MTDRKIIIVTGCRDWGKTETERRLVGTRIPKAKSISCMLIHPNGGASERAIAFAVRNGLRWDLVTGGGDLARLVTQHAGESVENVECYAFWDGVDTEALACISQATALGIPVRIVPRGR